MGDFLLTTVQSTDPSTFVVLHPLWEFTESLQQDFASHRTLNGSLYSYAWKAFHRIRVPLSLVDQGPRQVVVDAWRDDRQVAVTLDSSHHPSTVLCKITNDANPLDGLVPGFSDRWQGVLELESTGAAGKGGGPYILDDSVRGKLDQLYNALL